MRREERDEHREGVSIVGRGVGVCVRAIAFGVPHFDVWLFWIEVHCIAAVYFLLDASGIHVCFGVCQTVFQARKSKRSKGELAEEAGFMRLVLSQGANLRAIVPDEMVRCDTGLGDFIEDQGKLDTTSARPPPNDTNLLQSFSGEGNEKTHRMVHQILPHSFQIDRAFDSHCAHLAFGPNARPEQNGRAAE